MHTLTRCVQRGATDNGTAALTPRFGDARANATERHVRRTPGPFGAVALTLLVLLAGCDGSAPHNGASPTAQPTLPPTSTSAPGTAQEQAVAAYKGMWEAYARAGLTANPDDPELARYASGVALEKLARALRAYRDKGQVVKGEIRSNPQLADASPAKTPATMSVTDCVDTTSFLAYWASSGEPVNDVPGGRRSMLATVSDVSGVGWRVTSYGLQAVNTC